MHNYEHLCEFVKKNEALEIFMQFLFIRLSVSCITMCCAIKMCAVQIILCHFTVYFINLGGNHPYSGLSDLPIPVMTSKRHA